MSAAPPQALRSAARHRETTALLGMSVFVASWAMLFAALFFAYGMTRARALAWPPPDLPALPLGAGALATVAIIASSLALHGAGRRRTGSGAAHLVVAIAGALGFLAVQVLAWRQLLAAGLRPDGGSYASVFYGLTTFHAVHVAVGIAALAVLLVRALQRRQTPGLPLRLWTVYFDMVGVLWGLIYLGVYCL